MFNLAEGAMLDLQAIPLFVNLPIQSDEDIERAEVQEHGA